MAEAPPSEDAHLLGTSSAPLVIRSEVSSGTISLSTEGQRQLAAFLAAAPELRGQIHLKLNHLRGSHDATMLNVYVGPFADTVRHPPVLAGSWALYGLRTASLQYEGNPGTGLSKAFNITPLFSEWPAGPGAALSVSIVPGHPLPDSASLVLEDMSLYYLPRN